MIGSAVVLLGGCALLVSGLTLPAYYDRTLAMQEWNSWCAGGTSRGLAQQAAADRYFALFTWRYTLIDSGLNVALFAGTVAGIAYSLRMASKAGETWWRTPRSGASFILIGLGVIALNLIGWAISLRVDLSRYMFPWCADSVGIPLVGFCAVSIAAALVLVPLGILITRLFGVLPVSLLYWDRSRRLRSWSVTIIFLLIATLIGIAIALQIPSSGYLSVCAGAVALYLLAATRAAILAP